MTNSTLTARIEAALTTATERDQKAVLGYLSEIAAKQGNLEGVYVNSSDFSGYGVACALTESEAHDAARVAWEDAGDSDDRPTLEEFTEDYLSGLEDGETYLSGLE